MGSIDWPALIRGAVWILGLSICLAAWSYATWWAGVHRVSWRRAVAMPIFTVPFFVGLALFSAGLAWGLDRLWMRVLWAVIGVWCVWEIVRGSRMAASTKHIVPGEPDEETH
jgi:hypothetical protein